MQVFIFMVGDVEWFAMPQGRMHQVKLPLAEKVSAFFQNTSRRVVHALTAQRNLAGALRGFMRLSSAPAVITPSLDSQ
jgi:hypothetical protein